MRKKLFIPLIILLLAFTSTIVFHLTAQTPASGLTVDPSNLELQLSSGQERTYSITLTNRSKVPVDITVDRRNFSAEGEEGQVKLTTEENSFSLAQWMQVSPAQAHIDIGGAQSFTVTVAIPKNAEPGGHFGSVVFSTIPQKGQKQTGAALSQQIASLLLVAIPGTVHEQASIASFTTDKLFYDHGPVTFDTRIKNDSTIHIKPVGTVTVTNMFGQTATTQLDPRNVLPGAIRKIDATFNNKLLIGRYQASVAVAYGSQNNPVLTATTTFYAFPVKLGIAILIVLLLLFLLRKRIKKAVKILFKG